MYVHTLFVTAWLWENPPVTHKDNYLEKRDWIISRWNGPQGGPIALKLSQNIAKSMVYIINQPYGDFQQGAWLPVQADQWHSMDTRALVDVWQASETSLSKSRPVNIWQWCTGNWLAYWWSYPLTVKTVHWHGVRKWRVLAKQVTFIYNDIAARS